MEIGAAIAEYDALLRGNADLAQASGQLLIERQPALRLQFGSRLMCTCLRPNLIDPARYATVRRVCAVLAAASRRAETALLADPQLLAELDLSEEEHSLVMVDPGFDDAAAATRLDSFVAGESWQFVEYNAESPAGMGYTDGLSDLFRELPVMQAFERRYRLQALPTRRHMLDTLLRCYQQWGGQAAPRIAIVDWQGLSTASEFEIFKEFFERQGLSAVIVDPASLEYRDQRLYAGDGPVDLVYRRVLTHELLARLDEAPALVQAYRDHAVCVVNAFRCKLLHKKAIFAILSDEANANLFTAEQQAAIRRHIPWTRKVREGRTVYAGRQVELTEFILANRERLVLKPNDEYGGKGVVLGWEVDQGTWGAALARALAESSVVQERVATARSPFPVYRDGLLETVDLTVDLDPYIFGGQVEGVLTRVSPAALLNVTAGAASTVPTFIVQAQQA